MESTIDNLIFGSIVIGSLYVCGIMIAEILSDKKIKKDQNIEWYGPDVVLKNKEYPEINDDFRQEIGEIKTKENIEK